MSENCPLRQLVIARRKPASVESGLLLAIVSLGPYCPRCVFSQGGTKGRRVRECLACGDVATFSAVGIAPITDELFADYVRWSIGLTAYHVLTI